MISVQGQVDDLVLVISMAAIAITLSYLALLIVISRFRDRTWEPCDYSSQEVPQPDVVFMMPCLNEATVIGESIKRLLAMEYEKLHIIVIDDGSDDGTADIVRSFHNSRVSLYQRQLPEARMGKGKALNAAFRHIIRGGLGKILDPTTTVIVVVDADGRMDKKALNYVLPAFENPALAAVQIGVRINNRTSNLLARMQDLEFVLYTEVFQRGRVHMGSVGLGGNGQFVRMSALRLLGEEPWSESLTEDLDLGIRLHLLGMHLDYCPDVSVHQQGLVSMKRWVRQRTRWFQGYLQGWSQIPNVLNQLWGTTRVDLFIVLTSPIVLLIVTFFTLAFILWILAFGIGLAFGTNDIDWRLGLAYFVAFSPMAVLSEIYRKKEPELGYFKSFVLCHVYVFYAQLWGIAGWKAVWNQLRGQTGWAKTERVAESLEEESDDSIARPQLA